MSHVENARKRCECDAIARPEPSGAFSKLLSEELKRNRGVSSDPARHPGALDGYAADREERYR
jgi:hypothetical protein